MLLRVGTDCSGIDAPIEALNQLGIKYSHLWSCDNDKFARKSILANYKPKQIFNDITTRDHKVLPDIDMYICGFPCQPFSLLGKKEGRSDKRSNIMLHCISVIQIKQPKIFILENVKNFLYINNGDTYKYLLSKLKKNNNYNININIMNTRNYGIPQNRERIYIIGIMKNIMKNEFIIPTTIKTNKLDNFLIDHTIHNIEPKANALKIIKHSNINMSENNVIACAGYGNFMTNICPTITCSTPLYLTKYKRYISPKECLLLQGFSIDFKQVVSDHQLYKQCGNTMSVNVLKSLFKSIFKSIKT